MAKKPKDVQKVFHDKAQGPLDARMKRINNAAKTIEAAIDAKLEAGDAKDNQDHYEVCVYFAAGDLTVVMANEMQDLDKILAFTFQLAGWERFTQAVYPKMEGNLTSGYDLVYRLFKPIPPWHPHPSMDMTSLLRFGPSPSRGERYQPMNLPITPMTAEQRQAHEELSSFVGNLAKNARARNGNSEK